MLPISLVQASLDTSLHLRENPSYSCLAIFTGSLIQNVEPTPISDSTHISPLCISTIFFDIANITSKVYSTIKPKIDKLAASKGIGTHDWRPGLNKVARMICDEMDKRKGVDDGM